MTRIVLVAATCLLVAVPVGAGNMFVGHTGLSNCEHVVATFGDYVARRGLGDGEQTAFLADLGAVAASRTMDDRFLGLLQFHHRARQLEAHGIVSRFNSDRLAYGAEAAMLCLGQVPEPR